MNIELTLKHFKMCSHTQCSTDGIEMSDADRFIWEEGDEIKEFALTAHADVQIVLNKFIAENDYLFGGDA